MDGVDAALVDGSGELLTTYAQPYTENVATLLQRTAAGDPLSAGDLARLDRSIAEVFSRAALKLLDQGRVRPAQVGAIGSHGQNVYHGPRDTPPVTLQLGDPHVLATLTGITTVADFRRRDVALGGSGAPLAPALHQALFRSDSEDRAVLNLGGIANLTLLPADPGLPVRGFDTGPASCLMDDWCRRHQRGRYDAEGAWAASGQVSSQLVEDWLSDEYFGRRPPKSTGREKFDLGWALAGDRGAGLDPADVQASLCELTAVSIARALLQQQENTQRLLVCGGGVHNIHLVRRLQAALPGVQIDSTAVHGLGPDWVEAVLFAHLARAAVAGETTDLEAVTGAPPHVYGVVFPA